VRGVRQMFPVLLAIMLVACAAEDESKRGTIGFVEGFLGGVATDEPRAALIGREVLSSGGSAVDAAVAVYFALSVTLPSSAGLGGGGVCVVWDHKSKTAEAIDFLAQAPSRISAGATRPTAVPGNARGFFALHSKYGRLSWARLVSPAEKIARFGIPVSRSLAQNLATVSDALMIEPETRRIFGRRDGKAILGEGERIFQNDLAGVLGILRAKGSGDFYNGMLARQLVAGAKASGGSLSMTDLRAFKPQWRQTIKIPYGNKTLHFSPPPAAAGSLEAVMWVILEDMYDSVPAEERNHLLAETALRAYADRGQWMGEGGTAKIAESDLTLEGRIKPLMRSYVSNRHIPSERLRPTPVERAENPSATSFVVTDRDGSAVACGLTLNSLFGTGRVASGTGVLFAAAPDRGGRGPYSLGPMVVVNHNVNEFFFAAAASGGVTAPTALINVAARVLIDEQPLEDAIAAKRVHHSGMPDLTYYEQGLSQPFIFSLTQRHHKVAATPRLGLVNAISCSAGLPPNPGSCEIKTDPRGYGLATGAD